MGVGIDVLNVILADVRQIAPTNPLPVPAGTIQHTYHKQQPPSTIAQVQNMKLMLGAKREVRFACVLIMGLC
jgi:hypothetical protein